MASPAPALTSAVSGGSVSSSAGGAGGGDALSVECLLAAFQKLTPSQAADVLCALDKGMDIWRERTGGAASAASLEKPAPSAKKGPGRPRKVAAAGGAPSSPASAPAPALPSAGEDGAPDASAYRLDASAIRADGCQGRSLDGGQDKRWKPAVYRESQCGGARKEGCDLCAKCHARAEKAAAGSDPAKIGWNGRISEAPPSWSRMLGTAWADGAEPKWLGVASSPASASEAGSDSGGAAAEGMPAATASAKKEAAAAKKAEREAAKAKKEVEAAAKKAEKEAKKAAEKPKEKAPRKKKDAAAAPAPAAESAPAKADAEAPAAEASELKLIDGTLYSIKNGNVYEYDELTEQTGDFVGRLGPDGESIDTEADEEEDE